MILKCFRSRLLVSSFHLPAPAATTIVECCVVHGQSSDGGRWWAITFIDDHVEPMDTNAISSRHTIDLVRLGARRSLDAREMAWSASTDSGPSGELFSSFSSARASWSPMVPTLLNEARLTGFAIASLEVHGREVL